jgi:hypothetical protein
MSQKIKYIGINSVGHRTLLSLPLEESIFIGYKFEKENYEYTVDSIDEVKFLMHTSLKNLDVKINNNHEFTIKELYEKCPRILEDLLDYYGGAGFISQLLSGVTELYNQENP